MSLDQQLIEAAENGCLEKVEKFLKQGADIHAVGWDGYPDGAVRGAAFNGHLDVVRFLAFRPGLVRSARALPGVLINPRGCDNGADIHASGRFGHDYAVRWAAFNGHLDVVHFLFENGADIRAAGGYGPDGAVRWAARNGHLDVVRFLLEKGADIHAAADQYGSNDAVRGATQAFGSGHLDVVRFLVNPRKYGVDRDGIELKHFDQHHSDVLAQIQQLEQ